MANCTGRLRNDVQKGLLPFELITPSPELSAPPSCPHAPSVQE
jgi:hypothetical protein